MKKLIIVFLLLLNSVYADYTNISIQDYINIVATQNKINIATDKSIRSTFNFYINKEISGNVNIHVLQDILNAHGYVLVKESDDYFIIKSKEDLLINKMKIYQIRFADTKKIKEKIDFILKGYFKNIKRVKTSSNVRKFTPMQERKPGANNSNMTTKEIEKKINYAIIDLNNKSIAVTYKDKFVPIVAKSIIEEMDIPPARINVKLKIYEVSTTALKEFSNKITMEMKAGGLNIGKSISGLDGALDLGIGYDNSGAKITKFNLSAILTALQKKGKATIVSQPNIYLYEGHSSKLVEGKTFPVKSESTTVSNNSTTTSASYVDKDTGLILDIKFNEFRAGLINMTMSLNIDQVQDYDAQAKQLITKKRSLKTDMIISPGETINMAGLTSSTNSKSNGGIPLLMDIPIIGKLFTFKKDINDKNILLIELTANLVNGTIK